MCNSSIPDVSLSKHWNPTLPVLAEPYLDLLIIVLALPTKGSGTQSSLVWNIPEKLMTVPPQTQPSGKTVYLFSGSAT